MSLRRFTTISKQVIDEFNRRQNDFGASHPRPGAPVQQNLLSGNINENVYTGKGGRTPWIRVASGVNMLLKEDDPTSSDVKLAIRGSKIVLEGDENSSGKLINGIILEPDPNFERSYGLENNTGGFAYQTIGKTAKGKERIKIYTDRYRPAPIVTNVTRTYRSPYLVEASFTWEAYTQEQFEVLSRFFCNHQKTVVLEWGWSSFSGEMLDLETPSEIKLMRSNSTIGTIIRSINSVNDATSNILGLPASQITVDTSPDIDNGLELTPRQKRVLQQGVDYDLFVGIIKDFDIALSNGVYTVTTSLLSGADALAALSNEQRYRSFFNEGQFNKKLDDLLIAGDNRVWLKEYKRARANYEFDFDIEGLFDFDVVERVTANDLTDADLAIISEQRKVVENVRNYTFYNRTQRINENLYVPGNSPVQRIENLDTTKKELIADLGYVSDVELLKALIRRGALIPDFGSIDPEGEGYSEATLGTLLTLGTKALGFRGFENITNTELVANMREVRILIGNAISSRNPAAANTDEFKKIFDSALNESTRTAYYFRSFNGYSNDRVYDINVQDWITTPVLDYIRVALEKKHRETYWGSAQVLLYPGDEILGSATAGQTAYTSIRDHIRDRSTGRAWVDDVSLFGTWRFFLNMYSKATGGPGSRVRIPDSNDGSRNARWVQWLGIQSHLSTVDGRVQDTRNAETSASSGGSTKSKSSTSTAKTKNARESYGFITWGLLEELINSRILGNDSNSIALGKLDSSDTTIFFDENLISSNANVCIIPNKNAPVFDNGVPLTDEDGNRQSVDLSINGIDMHKKWSPNTGYVDIEVDNSAWLYSIFINIEIIKEVFSNTKNMKDALDQLLSYVNGACSDLFQFNLDRTGAELKVVDSRSVRAPEDRNKIYKFPYNTSDSFLTDISVNISLPNEMAIAATLGKVDGVQLGPLESAMIPLIRPEEDVFDLYSSDNLKTPTDDDDDANSYPGETDPDNFWEKNSQGRLVNFVYPNRDVVYRSVYGNNPVNNAVTVPGTNITLNMDGISGLRIWDAFKVDYVPSVYNQVGFFYITGMTDTVSNGSWTTEIQGQFRINPEITYVNS